MSLHFGPKVTEYQYAIMTESESTCGHPPENLNLYLGAETNGTLGLLFEEVHFDCPSNSCINIILSKHRLLLLL